MLGGIALGGGERLVANVPKLKTEKERAIGQRCHISGVTRARLYVFNFQTIFFPFTSFVHSSLLAEARTHEQLPRTQPSGIRLRMRHQHQHTQRRLYCISGLASFFFLSLFLLVASLCSARSNFYIVSFGQGMLKRFYTLQTAYSFGCFYRAHFYIVISSLK